MGMVEFPLVISPNLGCPKIISIEEILQGDVTLNIILAGQYGEFIRPTKDMFKDVFKLVPSYPEGMQEKICLEVNSDIIEITEWNRLFDFCDPEETQLLMSSEVHYNVLGEGTKYWLIKAVPRIDDLKKSGHETFLKKGEKGRYVPALYDLVFVDKPDHKKKINYHAVQFVETFKNGLNFIHLTDLHIAQRNDEILGEVLKIDKNEGVRDKIDSIFSKKRKEDIRGRDVIIKSYKNFNDNLRKFIHIANELSDRGELDFIVITGDVVDFAGLGWDETVSTAENNWKVFLDMMTGQGMERNRSFQMPGGGKEESNPGIRVAIFTSTGNHDWRLHPYSLLPYYGKDGQLEKFGLTEEEAKNYNYKSFDSSEFPAADKRKKLSDELTKESLKRLNLDAMDENKIKWEKWGIKSLEMLESKWPRSFLSPLGITASIAGAGIIGKFFTYLGALIPVAFVATKWFAERQLKKYADILVDNPLHAEVKALHYYFTHINPYFDYAFSFGDNHFILMDTGADVVTIRAEELMDGKKVEHLKKASFQDNILGLAPDSMAFDDRQAYYNWEQLVWLDQVLSSISKMQEEKGRIFICLHAPPVNHDPKCNKLLEGKLEEKIEGNIKYISEGDCNLTYGTINHYLSQFFFLCCGLRENPHRRISPFPPLNSDLEKVDLVLSGHAHINVEFRVDTEFDGQSNERKVRIYHDKYSEHITGSQFEEKRPFMILTAACGPHSDNNNSPPYWRRVKIDGENCILSFRHESIDEWLKSKKN